MTLNNLIDVYLSNFTETRLLWGLLIATFAFYWLVRKMTRKSCKLPPGPIGIPFFGYLPFVHNNPHKAFQKLSEKYGNIFSLYLGRKLTVICNDWTSASEALGKAETANRPPGIFDALPGGFGHGDKNGNIWTEQRRFTVKTMRDTGFGRPEWEALLQEEVDEIIESIRSTKGQTVDVRQTFARTFTKNIMTLMFGNRLPALHPALTLISDGVDYIMERFGIVTAHNFLPKLSSYLFKIGLYGSKKVAQKLVEFNKVVCKYTDEEMAKHGKDDQTFVDVYRREVEQQKSNPKTNITEHSFYGNVQVLLLGGSETSRTSFLFLLIAMAKHPATQERIQKELDEVLGRDGIIHWSDRAKVPYTYAAIMESMRWNTIIPVNSIRMTVGDIKIQGYDVPNGTCIIVNQWALHNDPKYWPEPEKFKPERFLLNGETQINANPESYMPFSLGKRNCPGKMVALMELFQYFICVMRHFTVLPPEDGVVRYQTSLGLTYQPKNLKLRFIPRNVGPEKSKVL